MINAILLSLFLNAVLANTGTVCVWLENKQAWDCGANSPGNANDPFNIGSGNGDGHPQPHKGGEGGGNHYSCGSNSGPRTAGDNKPKPSGPCAYGCPKDHSTPPLSPEERAKALREMKERAKKYEEYLNSLSAFERFKEIHKRDLDFILKLEGEMLSYPPFNGKYVSCYEYWKNGPFDYGKSYLEYRNFRLDIANSKRIAAAYFVNSIKEREGESAEYLHRDKMYKLADYYLNDAFRTHDQKKYEESIVALKLAEVLLDFTTALTPGVSWARDLYEAVMGVDLISGDKLEVWQRTFAFMGVLSAGVISNIPTVYKVLDKLACSPEMIKGVRILTSDGLYPDQLRHLWSKGPHNDAAKNIIQHWQKHKHEFPELDNEYEYLRMTWDFVTKPPADTLSKISKKNGNTVLYDPVSNIFAVVEKNTNVPATMFKPAKKMEYYNAQ